MCCDYILALLGFYKEAYDYLTAQDPKPLTDLGRIALLVFVLTVQPPKRFEYDDRIQSAIFYTIGVPQLAVVVVNLLILFCKECKKYPWRIIILELNNAMADGSLAFAALTQIYDHIVWTGIAYFVFNLVVESMVRLDKEVSNKPLLKYLSTRFLIDNVSFFVSFEALRRVDSHRVGTDTQARESLVGLLRTCFIVVGILCTYKSYRRVSAACGRSCSERTLRSRRTAHIVYFVLEGATYFLVVLYAAYQYFIFGVAAVVFFFILYMMRYVVFYFCFPYCRITTPFGVLYYHITGGQLNTAVFSSEAEIIDSEPGQTYIPKPDPKPREAELQQANPDLETPAGSARSTSDLYKDTQSSPMPMIPQTTRHPELNYHETPYLPTYGSPSPGYRLASPVYGMHAPVYGSPSLAYGMQPQPPTYKHSSTFEEPRGQTYSPMTPYTLPPLPPRYTTSNQAVDQQSGWQGHQTGLSPAYQPRFNWPAQGGPGQTVDPHILQTLQRAAANRKRR